MKKASWNRKALTTRLGIKAYFAHNCLYYAQPLTIAQFQLVTNLTWPALAGLTIVQTNQFTAQTVLAEVQLQELCLELDFDCQAVKEVNLYQIAQQVSQKCFHHQWRPKPPVVAVMGHVDHGKTTLLDTLRRSQLVANEPGQITQKMAAYQVLWKQQAITFLDTPGHKLFRLMRVQSSQVTDLIILLIAANEGVKAQTLEAIKHAQTHKVPLIVFLNKTDLPHLQIETIKTTLTKLHLTPTEWGGKTRYFQGMAKEQTTLAPLLDAIIAFRDHNQLRYCPTCLPQGTVLEAYQTGNELFNQILLQTGQLKPQMLLVTPTAQIAKVRTLLNDRQQSQHFLNAGTAAAVAGFPLLLPTGGQVYGFYDRELVEFINEYQTLLVSQRLFFNRKHPSAEQLWAVPAPQPPTNFMIKVDSKGSEAVLQPVLDEICQTNFYFKLIQISTGPITNQDLHLAVAAHAHLLLFNLPCPFAQKNRLKMHNLTVTTFALLHELIAFLTTFKELKAPQVELELLGEAKVIRLFRHSKLGLIAGCVVSKGTIKVSKTTVFHHYRKHQQLSTKLEIKSMQQERVELKQAQTNQEVGIIFKTNPPLAINDQLKQFKVVMTKACDE